MDTHLSLCHECDLLHENPDITVGKSAHCSRCGALLFHKQDDGFTRSLAFTVAGLVFFVLANLFPILSFSMRGNTKYNQLIDGALTFLETDYWPLGIIVLVFSVIAPFLVLCFLLIILVPIQLGMRPRFLKWQLRSLIWLRPWAMAEILLVGIMVAYVKLGDVAIVHVGISLASIMAMVLMTLLAFASLDFHTLWNRVSHLQEERST